MNGLLPPLETGRRERAALTAAALLAVAVFTALLLGPRSGDPWGQERFTYEGTTIRCTVVTVHEPTGDRALNCPGLVDRLDPSGNERLTAYTTGSDPDRVRLWSGRYQRAWEPTRV